MSRGDGRLFEIVLKFYDDGHVYELDGKIIPSVSELLRFMSREVYGDIDKYILDHAAERGNAVHLATQEIDASGSCEIEYAYSGYVQAYTKFLREHEVQWLYTEKALADVDLGYAGTLDRMGFVDGAYGIVDLKTNSVIKKNLVKAQLNAYYDLVLANGLKRPERLWCLQLCESGRYRLYDEKIDPTEFKACLILHASMKKRHGRMKIE